jgi:hypothetical protein
MPVSDIFRFLRDYAADENNAYTANTQKLFLRLADVFVRTWDLGFTAFGGPPVHFQIEHRRFVEGKGRRTPWIDEQVVRSSFPVLYNTTIVLTWRACGNFQRGK